MIITVIRKSDGKKFVWEKQADSDYVLDPNTSVLPAPEVESATYNYAMADGSYAPHDNARSSQPLQLRRGRAFTINGWMFNNGRSVSEMAIELNEFFRIREYYQVVYSKCSGVDFYLDNVIITDLPFISQTPGGAEDLLASVEISFLALDGYQYKAVFDETTGELVYSSSIEVPKVEPGQEGGRVWLGGEEAEWTATGKTWKQGSVSFVDILVESATNINPIITITGLAGDPEILDITTNSRIKFNGTVAEGQKLVLDCQNQTAKLGGANVVGSIEGDWLEIKPGINRFVFTATGTSDKAKLEWADVVG